MARNGLKVVSNLEIWRNFENYANGQDGVYMGFHFGRN